jgi:hypothetical protein
VDCGGVSLHLKDILKQNIDKLTIPLTSTGLPAEPARLLFGRGNHIPGWDFLNIDIFPPLIFITLYETCSNEKVEDLVNQLQELFPGCPIWVQDRSVRRRHPPGNGDKPGGFAVLYPSRPGTESRFFHRYA